MAVPATAEELLGLLKKSGVVDESRLGAFLQKARGAGNLASEPEALSRQLVQVGIITGFQAEQLMEGKWKRFTIGKYKVLDRVGSGGMGSVYLCEHKFMRRRAAIKVLPVAHATDPSALERFYREARAIAALDHPNIVRAYDVDQEEELHYLVMEYVDGLSLQDVVKKEGPLDPARCASYISQAALGLQHAHEVAGIVHRDIKPANLIVDRGGTLKILDMGLARFFEDEGESITQKFNEHVLGTADYLAPEQVLDSHTVDIRADIYSLGATAYFCLTGRTPFVDGTVSQKLIWHQTRQPKPIRSLRPEVPEGLVKVVEKMLAKDPNERYQTPLEVAQAFAPWAQAEAPAKEAGPPANPPRPVPPSSLTPSPRKPWQVKGSPQAPVTPAPRAPKQQPVATVTPRPAGARPALADTKEMLAAADTDPKTSPRPARKRAPVRKASRTSVWLRPPRVWWLAAGGVVALVVLILLLVWIF